MKIYKLFLPVFLLAFSINAAHAELRAVAGSSSGSGSGITALTGDVTASGPGSAAATVAKVQGTTVSGTTGTGNVMFSASPTTTGTLTGAAATFSGKVGIGTATTTNMLDVYGAAGQGVAIGSSYAGTNTAPPNGLIVQGKVGLGTPTPLTNASVDIRTTNTSWGNFHLGSGNSNGDLWLTTAFSNAFLSLNQLYNGSGFVYETGGGAATIDISGGNGVAGAISFQIAAAGSAGSGVTNTTVMTINNQAGGGFVGIGTVTPLVKLDVNGPIKTKGYTVATLPTGVIGMYAYVTDQLTTCPVLDGTFTGGGNVVCSAFYNGTAWVHN
jgi:hypothetical protein